MPTIFTHIAVPVAVAVAMGGKRIPPTMLLAGMLAAIVPDFDSVAFNLGIHYGSMLGHRGFTHTIAFALVVGLAGWWLAPRWSVARWKGFAWMAFCAFSHPLLDTLTNGGIGIALWWPVSNERFFSPWRPVEVSPVAFSRFFTPRGAQVLLNELQTIWLPLMAAALAIFALRHSRKNK